MATCLNNIIREYEGASDQAVNFDKSSLCFSPNVDSAMKNNIKAIFGIKVMAGHTNYLGLPSSLSKNWKDIFMPIVTRVSRAVAC